MTNVTFIILGATGDLARRKLIPAIYALLKNKKITNFAVIGVARRPISAEEMLKAARPFVKNVNPAIWRKLQQHSYYQQLDFSQQHDFPKLKQLLAAVEKKQRLSGKRIFYFATLPEHFDRLTHNLAKLKIVFPTSKLVYEKPFGSDLQSARAINRCLHCLFPEKQIYRLDHYLGKELVENIAILRFTNRVLEPLWNNQHIESVQITLSEDFGVEGRGEFYDKYGAVKDMMQGHALQLLALTAMEMPRTLRGEDIREQKVKVLKKVVGKDLLAGQYEGYLQEPGVQKHSTTETFAVTYLEINNQRWKGVPFYIKTGKYLKKKETRIDLKFKKVECLLMKSCPTDSNYLTIHVQPNEGFDLELNAKKPGAFAVVPVKMNFCYSCLFGLNTPEAYEVLLEEVRAGNQSLFVRQDEVEQAWRIIDALCTKGKKVFIYPRHGNGPAQLTEWNKRYGLKWKA